MKLMPLINFRNHFLILNLSLNLLFPVDILIKPLIYMMPLKFLVILFFLDIYHHFLIFNPIYITASIFNHQSVNYLNILNNLHLF